MDLPGKLVKLRGDHLPFPLPPSFLFLEYAGLATEPNLTLEGDLEGRLHAHMTERARI